MTNHPKIQLGPDNLYINDKPITDMTIEERIEEAKKVVGHGKIGYKRFYIFSESELNALLRQVQDEQKEICAENATSNCPSKLVWEQVDEDCRTAPYAYEEEG